MARVRALILTASVVAAATFGTLVPLGGGRAGAAGAHRALVIVDTGATTYQRVVTFDSDSITGIQALDLAGANPVVYSFSGQGGAVCRLFGVGRDAGPNCLGGVDGDNRYWGYFRAPSGSSTFTYSRAGAGSTQVHDGDVEGWKFATGQAPTWSGLSSSTTTTTAPPPPVTVAPGRGGSTAGGGTTPGSSSTGLDAWATEPTPDQTAAPGQSATTTTNGPLAATAAEVRGAATERARSGRSASRAAVGPKVLAGDGNGGTTSWRSIVGFGAAAGAIVGIGLYVRRSRSHPIP